MQSHESNVVEVWRDTHLTSDYEVSNLGRVRSKERLVPARAGSFRLKKARFLKGTAQRYGHVCYSIRVDKKPVYTYGHQLVMRAFVGDYPTGKPNIAHLNGDPSDNRLSNLAYASDLANAHDRVYHDKHGRGRPRPAKPVFLNKTEVQQLRRIAEQLEGADADLIRLIVSRVGKPLSGSRKASPGPGSEAPVGETTEEPTKN